MYRRCLSQGKIDHRSSNGLHLTSSDLNLRSVGFGTVDFSPTVGDDGVQISNARLGPVTREEAPPLKDAPLRPSRAVRTSTYHSILSIDPTIGLSSDDSAEWVNDFINEPLVDNIRPSLFDEKAIWYRNLLALGAPQAYDAPLHKKATPTKRETQAEINIEEDSESSFRSSQPSSASAPSSQPQPSSLPSAQPSSQPSSAPSSQPSSRSSSAPPSQPSSQPSEQPSSQPSEQHVRSDYWHLNLKKLAQENSKKTSSSSAAKKPSKKKKSKRTIDENVVCVPTDDDVLFGRGGFANKHPGNITFRKTALGLRSVYKRSSKEEKYDISQILVESVMSDGGRFLEKGQDGEWHPVIGNGIRKKASQALREKINETEK